MQVEEELVEDAACNGFPEGALWLDPERPIPTVGVDVCEGLGSGAFRPPS